MNTDLFGNTSRVETPFIILQLGKYSFGLYNRQSQTNIEAAKAYSRNLVNYPNYMKSLSVNKVNGTVNSYTISMTYAITKGDDPNLLEKIFSSISKTRRAKISYGDLSAPTFIYKEEELIIYDIKSRMNLKSSCIDYTLYGTSVAKASTAGYYSFEKVHAKPSDEIKRILYDNRYGLLDVFYGMRDKELVLTHNLIIADDKAVDIEAKEHINILEYLNYLVSCMVSVTEVDDELLKNNKYSFLIIDDTSGIFGGPYFKVVRNTANINSKNLQEVYTIDIGYAGKDIILDFSIDDDQTYSILYDYSKNIELANDISRIDDNGNIINLYSPKISNNARLLKTTASDETWWTNVTQYPISATLSIKGLLKPAILMNAIRLNVYFFGQKHISSGFYIVTKQVDYIDESGFKTVLSLTRIQGDA